jgi:hypothetical protein
MVSDNIQAFIMRNDDYGTAIVPLFPQNVQDTFRAICIRESRRFVKHQNLRLSYQHTGDTDTLTLATAQAFATLSYHHV